jgi:hypothetical protein
VLSLVLLTLQEIRKRHPLAQRSVPTRLNNLIGELKQDFTRIASLIPLVLFRAWERSIEFISDCIGADLSESERSTMDRHLKKFIHLLTGVDPFAVLILRTLVTLKRPSAGYLPLPRILNGSGSGEGSSIAAGLDLLSDGYWSGEGLAADHSSQGIDLCRERIDRGVYLFGLPRNEFAECAIGSHDIVNKNRIAYPQHFKKPMFLTRVSEILCRKISDHIWRSSHKQPHYKKP